MYWFNYSREALQNERERRDPTKRLPPEVQSNIVRKWHDMTCTVSIKFAGKGTNFPPLKILPFMFLFLFQEQALYLDKAREKRAKLIVRQLKVKNGDSYY